MEPFASVEDYRERYPEDESEDTLVNTVLMEATDLISAELDGSDIDYSDPSESFTYRLMRVCRTVAHRAIGGGEGSDIPFGATQLEEKSEQFSASVHLGNPYGDLFLTAAERESLGIGGGRACVVSPY